MKEETSFFPDWASPPGATIDDLLVEQQLSRDDLANHLGRAVAFVDRLIAGQAEVTAEIARSLERVIGSPATFWMRRETQYREQLALLQPAGAALSDWVSKLPLKEMLKFGWVRGGAKTPAEIAATCLSFFGVPDLRAWREKYANATALAAFRTSPTFAAETESVAAWLRQGEILAEQAKCLPWDAGLLKAILPQLRALTRVANPKLFLPELTRLGAGCGVAVVVVRAPSGCQASGATRFIAEDRAVVQMSFRFLSDDHFWFTFFHEVAHLLLHRHTALHLEGVEPVAASEEAEANQFAADLLIPPATQAAMRSLPLDGREVIRFAQRQGVAPGIVVGQLQHHGCITRRQLNTLKRRYRWSD
jgi:plasmid maintenance system antidote protein VapI